jgi:hypothetical protein
VAASSTTASSATDSLCWLIFLDVFHILFVKRAVSHANKSNYAPK